jgi:hypothetical protein
VRERFSASVQTGPGANPASCTMGTWSFPGVKSGRGVTLTPHPLLMPWSRNGRARPLLPLWTVRPVQSLSACTWVYFAYLTFVCSECAIVNLATVCFRQMTSCTFNKICVFSFLYKVLLSVEFHTSLYFWSAYRSDGYSVSL